MDFTEVFAQVKIKKITPDTEHFNMMKKMLQENSIPLCQALDAASKEKIWKKCFESHKIHIHNTCNTIMYLLNIYKILTEEQHLWSKSE